VHVGMCLCVCVCVYRQVCESMCMRINVYQLLMHVSMHMPMEVTIHVRGHVKKQIVGFCGVLEYVDMAC
jgi:hypothetical protein